MLLAVAGCVGSMEGEAIFRRAPFVDIVLGPRSVDRLGSLIEAARARGRAVDVGHHPESVLFPWETTERAPGAHAYITVVEGCNKACTFCIVPTTRGRETSRRMEDILAEVRHAVSAGAREVEFLGQTVNAYKDPGGRGLAELLLEADKVPGLDRMRFTTSHPLHMSGRLIDAMSACARLVRSLHLPVQSGSDDVLAAMQRGYTAAGYRERIARLRAALPGIGLSTDIIVGFPGETESDFARTLELLDAVGFDTVYSFLYSPRRGTAAAALEDPVAFEEKAERLARLQARQGEIQLERHREWIGRDAEVLVEGPAKTGDGFMTGRTRNGQIVNFPGGGELTGRLARLTIVQASPYSLRGELLG
jgi:tRNA-2-methylthio-N6-dimethylallyladenosine synthase